MSVEPLKWNLAAELPDAELTVILFAVSDGGPDWFSGWWDGYDWRDCATGDVVRGTVTHWAEPTGPGV